MDRFPSEFVDLLNRRGRRLFHDLPHLETLIAKRRTPIVILDDVLDADVVRDCIRLLDEGMYPHLRRMHTPVPREALAGMKKNYQEELPKTVKVRTATFNAPKSKVLAAAREIGLAEMMASSSMLRLAQAASKPALRSDWWARQVICYEAGDYSGPHNDHHPENAAERNGFALRPRRGATFAMAPEYLDIPPRNRAPRRYPSSDKALFKPSRSSLSGGRRAAHLRDRNGSGRDCSACMALAGRRCPARGRRV